MGKEVFTEQYYKGAGIMNIPNELLYTKTHEWVKKLNSKEVIMGITDFAQQQLKDIVFVELPSVGKELKMGKPCAVVESRKSRKNHSL